MGKKKAFAKGGGANKSNAVNGIFKVSGVQQKKKPKAVKTQIKKIQANVKVQQEASDKKLKDLHVQMVTKKPAQNKINLPKKKPKKPTPNASGVQNKLEKMNVG